MRPDVLDTERTPRRLPRALAGRRGRWGAAVALVLALTTITAVWATGPQPLRVRLARVDGSALRGDSFLRLQLRLQGSGVERLDEVSLRLAGSTSPGSSLRGFDGRGRADVQVDVVPDCPSPDLAGSSVRVTVTDRQGRPRTTELPLPVDGVVERLVAYRCETAA